MQNFLKEKIMKKHKMVEDKDDDGMKRGGKAKKKGIKAEGKAAKMRMDKPMKRATGGKVMESTDTGITPSSPLSASSPQRGGKK